MNMNDAHQTSIAQKIFISYFKYTYRKRCEGDFHA
jgi:hypothetical protein